MVNLFTIWCGLCHEDISIGPHSTQGGPVILHLCSLLPCVLQCGILFPSFTLDLSIPLVKSSSQEAAAQGGKLRSLMGKFNGFTCSRK